jgi:hypothetical protein
VAALVGERRSDVRGCAIGLLVLVHVPLRGLVTSD